MSKILQGFKNWVFESRSFLFSWYTQDRNQIQEQTKSLIELQRYKNYLIILRTQKQFALLLMRHLQNGTNVLKLLKTQLSF